MPEPALEARFERLLDLPLGAMRATMAHPQPPPQGRVAPITGLRVIVALEGRKPEIFGAGDAIAEWAMRAGDVLVLRPDTWLIPQFTSAHRHFGAIVLGDRVRVGWYRCNGQDDRQRPLVTEAEVVVQAPARSALAHLAEVLAGDEIHRQGPAARQVLQAFLQLLRAAALAAPRERSRAQATWDQALSYIADHSDRQLARAEVANWLGVSENYLSRLCRRRGGAAFVGIVTRQRLTRAASLLRAIDLPIAAVGEACGFADPSYFIRRFRRAFGQTPREYRRAQRSGRR